MAYKSEGASKPCKGLSFIDLEGLDEEEYLKLDKIINSTSVCSGVQFPFGPEADKTAGTETSDLAAEGVQDAPVFQSAIPPPPIVGYSIPVHHWTHGDPSMGPPPGASYPITVQGGYVFPNRGDVTMAFVPALTSGQPLYAITGVPGQPIPPNYQSVPMPQSEPVDLSVPLTRPSGETVSVVPPIVHSQQHVVITHASHNDGIMAASHMDSPMTLSHHGIITQPHVTQVMYISQSSIAPPQPTCHGIPSSTPANVTGETEPPTTESPAIAGLPPVQQSPSIEFGGPVVFSENLPELPKEVTHNSNKLPVSSETVNREVVIDMEDLSISDNAVNPNKEMEHLNSSSVTKHSLPAEDMHTANISVPANVADNLNASSNTISQNNSSPQSPVSAVPAQSDSVTHKNNASEVATKQPAAPPVKMWSSLFGSNKSNGAVTSAPTAARPSNAITAAVPNAIVTEELKSVRYWQEQDKAESKQTFVPTEKVIPVGVQNDPLATRILEQLFNLPIIHTPIVIQPRGLVNGSNTCFMNATLQVLMGCPPFVHMFRAFKNLPTRPGSHSSTPIFDSLVQFVNSFQNGQRIRNQGSRNKKGAYTDINVGQPFSPVPLLSVAQNILKLHIGVQHDAEEFLSQILMICHEELENVMKLNHPDGLNNNEKEENRNGYAQDSVNEIDDEEDDESWQKVGPKNHHVETNVNDCGQTPLSSIFAGLSRSCLIRESGKTSDTVDSFFTLKLDIQADNVHSVKEALLRLNSIETVHDADGGKIQGQRRTFFDVLPPVLIMHLKLFQYSNGNGQKIQKKISFDVDLVIPKETLSRVGKTKLANPKSRTYKLFGVVNHHGMKMNDGHYTSDVYLPAASGWLRFDDSEVIAIHEAQVLQYSERRMPYLLFYRRMDVS